MRAVDIIPVLVLLSMSVLGGWLALTSHMQEHEETNKAPELLTVKRDAQISMNSDSQESMVDVLAKFEANAEAQKKSSKEDPQKQQPDTDGDLLSFPDFAPAVPQPKDPRGLVDYNLAGDIPEDLPTMENEGEEGFVVESIEDRAKGQEDFYGLKANVMPQCQSDDGEFFPARLCPVRWIERQQGPKPEIENPLDTPQIPDVLKDPMPETCTTVESEVSCTCKEDKCDPEDSALPSGSQVESIKQLGSQRRFLLDEESSSQSSGNQKCSVKFKKCARKAEDVAPYTGDKIDIVFFTSQEEGGGWWPFDATSTMNSLVDKAEGCLLTTKSCAFHFGDADSEVFKKAKAIIFHAWHVGSGWDVGSLLNKLGGSKPDGQVWIMFSLESNANYPIQEDKSFLDHIDMKMTYDLDNPVPVTYANRVWEQSFFMLQQKKRNDADAIFVSSNCSPKNKRLDYVRAIMKHIKVHSYGACENNRGWDEEDSGQDSRRKLALQGSYKFCLTFDNTDQKDYISEKFYHGLAAGCLPVYMGSPTINWYLPEENAVVKTAEFNDGESLGKYLNYLVQNTTAYWEKLSWKWTQKEAGFPRMQRLLYLSYPTAPCRLCEYLAGMGTVPRTQEQQNAMYKSTRKVLVGMDAYKKYHEHNGPMDEDQLSDRPHQDV